MATVNFVCTHFFPFPGPAANRHNALVRVLLQEHDVNVIFTRDRGRNLDTSVYRSFPGDASRLTVRSVGQADYDPGRFVSRALFETLSALRLNLLNLRTRADVTVVAVPYLMLLPVSGLFARLSRRPWVLDVQDLIWEYGSFNAKGLTGALLRLVGGLCRWAVRGFDRVVTCTEPQRARVAAITPRPVVRIPNGVGMVAFSDLGAVLLKHRKHEDALTVSYLGAIGFPQNLATLLAAARLLWERGRTGVRIRIAGRGPKEKWLVEQLGSGAYPNVQFMGQLAWPEVVEAYLASDVLYAQLRDTPEMETAEPTKLLEYAATGLPFIYGGRGAGAELCRGFRNATLVPPDDPKALADAIAELERHWPGLSVSNRERVGRRHSSDALLDAYRTVVADVTAGPR